MSEAFVAHNDLVGRLRRAWLRTRCCRVKDDRGAQAWLDWRRELRSVAVEVGRRAQRALS